MPKRMAGSSTEAILPNGREGTRATAPALAAVTFAGASGNGQPGAYGQMTITVTEAISASLLRVARSLEERGLIHQAVAAYLKVIVRYSDSPEASVAVDKILAIVDGFRVRGQHQSAMTVLDRLEAVRLPEYRTASGVPS